MATPTWDEYVGYCSNETHCSHKNDGIELETFAYKGCWNCQHFALNDEQFMTVEQASENFGKPEAVIRKLCRDGKLDARLCEQERFENKGCFCGTKKAWLIKKED